jgi:hypothetical protein
VLTRLDVLEKQIHEQNKYLSQNEKVSILSSQKDKKIEKIIDTLGVKRSDVHFLENYHSDSEENYIEVDYLALKTLGDLINMSEQYVIYYLNKSATCFARCF